MARHIDEDTKVWKDRKQYKPTLRHLNDALASQKKQLLTKLEHDERMHPRCAADNYKYCWHYDRNPFGGVYTYYLKRIAKLLEQRRILLTQKRG